MLKVRLTVTGAIPGAVAVMTIGYEPGTLEAPLVKLIGKLFPVAGFVKAVVTPAGTPETENVIAPVKFVRLIATLIGTVVFFGTARVLVNSEIVKLPGAVTVSVTGAVPWKPVIPSLSRTPMLYVPSGTDASAVSVICVTVSVAGFGENVAVIPVGAPLNSTSVNGTGAV